jgi:hypothetical protein
MKTIANRLIVFAASAIALGTVAYGQTRMTAQIPFAFHTVNGTLPAGTYEFSKEHGFALADTVVIRNVATGGMAFAGHSLYNSYGRTPNGPRAVFVCGKDGCSLKAIRTWDAALEYNVPKSRNAEQAMAVITVPLKPLSTD